MWSGQMKPGFMSQLRMLEIVEEEIVKDGRTSDDNRIQRPASVPQSLQSVQRWRKNQR